MGFDLNITISAMTVFLQGLLSFFSPCILPIIPLYMGYLSGGAYETDEQGNKKFNQKTVLINTLFFVLGTSFAFFTLGLGFSALGKFFTENQYLLAKIGGVLIILLGLIQFGLFEKLFKSKEYRLPIQINALKMNPFTALCMGFVFSFAWTPCVGPALSTVLIMISNTQSTMHGILLMAVYTLGFILPFLFVGMFTTKCLNLFKKHRNVVKYTIKIGAVIMIIMGILMLTGTMNSVTSYLADYTSKQSNNTSPEPTNNAVLPQEVTVTEEPTEAPTAAPTVNPTEAPTAAPTEAPIPALDFELEDQYGNVHKLTNYKGKVVFLNIWATWCPPCREEMPDIEKIYKEYGYNKEDVVILGVAFPSDENKYTQEKSKQEVIKFMNDNNYTYPTLLDMKGDLLMGYGISAFPTTFMIDVNGNIFGYVPGMMSYDIMKSIIEQTLSGERN